MGKSTSNPCISEVVLNRVRNNSQMTKEKMNEGPV